MARLTVALRVAFTVAVIAGGIQASSAGPTTAPSNKPSTAPTTSPALPWEANASAWPMPTGPFAKMVAGHGERWKQYAKLAMTPLDDSGVFRAKLDAALHAELVGLPDPPEAAYQAADDIKSIPHLATTGALTPQGPLDPTAADALTRDVHDALLYVGGGKFEAQRGRFLAHRAASIPYPDYFKQLVDEQWHEPVDAKTLSEEARWDYVRRLYDARHTNNSGFDVKGVALDGPSSLCGVVWWQTVEKGNQDWLCSLLLQNDTYRYWRGEMIHCGLPVTEPVPTDDAVFKRYRKILRAQVEAVLELRNGERAPVSISAFFDPETKHWGFNGVCMTSSPFEGQIISTR